MIAALLFTLGCATAAQAGQTPAAPPSGPASTPAVERLVDVVVHGNHTTLDADVIAIAGLAIGEPLPPGAIAAATRRLEAADRFESVEIRKRYRSIERLDEVEVFCSHDVAEFERLAGRSPAIPPEYVRPQVAASRATSRPAAPAG